MALTTEIQLSSNRSKGWPKSMVLSLKYKWKLQAALPLGTLALSQHMKTEVWQLSSKCPLRWNSTIYRKASGIPILQIQCKCPSPVGINLGFQNNSIWSSTGSMTFTLSTTDSLRLLMKKKLNNWSGWWVSTKTKRCRFKGKTSMSKMWIRNWSRK